MFYCLEAWKNISISVLEINQTYKYVFLNILVHFMPLCWDVLNGNKLQEPYLYF